MAGPPPPPLAGLKKAPAPMPGNGTGGLPPPPPSALKKAAPVALPPPMAPAPMVIGGGPLPPPSGPPKAPPAVSRAPAPVAATGTTKKVPSVLNRKTPEQIAEEEFAAMVAKMEAEEKGARRGGVVNDRSPAAPVVRETYTATPNGAGLPPPAPPVSASAAPSYPSSNIAPPPAGPHRIAPSSSASSSSSYSSSSSSHTAPPPMAKRSNFLGGGGGKLANRKTAEEEAAEEMERLLLEAAEPAPRRGGVVPDAKPVEIVRESYAGPPKRYTSYGRRIFDDEEEQRAKREAPFTPLPRGYISRYTVPSNVPKHTIVTTANEAYIKAIYEGFRNVQFLENAIDEDWENYLLIEWDNILGDPAFLAKYADPRPIMGRLKSTRVEQGFENSMDTLSSSMKAPCASSDTPERNTIASVRRFVITLDSSLPESVVPDFNWDNTNKILTITHNLLSLVDGIYKVEFKTLNGSYSNWFQPMYLHMTGKTAKLEVKDYHTHSTMGHADWSNSRSRTRKTPCFFCKGTGMKKGVFVCNYCEGTGMRE